MLKTYYLLTKPGIILGNLITTAGAFALASKGVFDGWLFFAMLAGLGLVIASACVFNNYLDRHIDQKMARTKNRPLAKGAISVRSALLFAVFTGLIGIAILALYTNLLAALLAAAGFVIYVLLYSLLKTHTSHATLIGSLSGATPPVIGYCAVTNRFDAGALLLFIILVLWQMPHFFAIALYRLEDYAAASIPVLPIKKGNQATKIQMLLYVIAFLIAELLLIAFGYTGSLYFIVSTLLGLAWILLSLKGFRVEDDQQWAKQMFSFSLVVITALSILISIDATNSESPMAVWPWLSFFLF